MNKLFIPIFLMLTICFLLGINNIKQNLIIKVIIINPTYFILQHIPFFNANPDHNYTNYYQTNVMAL